MSRNSNTNGNTDTPTIEPEVTQDAPEAEAVTPVTAEAEAVTPESTPATTDAASTTSPNKGKYEIPADIAGMADVELAYNIIVQRKAEGFDVTEVTSDETDVDADDAEDAAEQPLTDEELDALSDAEFREYVTKHNFLQSKTKTTKVKSSKQPSERLFKMEWELKTRIWESYKLPGKASELSKDQKSLVKQQRLDARAAIMRKANRLYAIMNPTPEPEPEPETVTA